MMENILNKKGIAAIIMLCQFLPVAAQRNESLTVVPTDTLAVLSGKTIIDEKRVYAKNILRMNNTTLTGDGNLVITAEEGIVLTGVTKVALGATLKLNGRSQYAVICSYDASGNRVLRKRKPTEQ